MLNSSLSRYYSGLSLPKDDQHPQDEPDFLHFSNLLASLMLCTILGLVSALDAKQQCLKHETYALLDLVDDDNFQKAYDSVVNESGNKCAQMFKYVLVPTGAATVVVGILALLILQRHWRRGNHQLLSATTTPTKTAANFSVCFRLLICSLAILAAQTYNIIAVMLQPRGSSTSEDNPYQSLAAVDHYGHVGDNANLYYLAWVSQAFTLGLVYQLSTVTVRLWRTTRAATGQQLLPAMSWETRDFSESRAAWYQSIYKLRIRTGIWVAALLTAMVIVASSQYVWNAVLWPYAVQIDPTVSHTSASVCTIVNSQRSSSKYGYSNSKYLAPQLCYRTAAAWLSGLAAVVLCVTAIGIHWYARRGVARIWHDHDDIHPCSNKHAFVQAAYRYGRQALAAELFLSMLLSVLLGFNAVFATGVQGPAATVGNLYYASWLCFLLCVRICLGCLEEIYDIDDKSENGVVSTPGAQASESPVVPYQAPSYKDQQQQQQQVNSSVHNDQHQQVGGSGQEQQAQEREVPIQFSSRDAQHSSRDSSEQTMTDPLERERAKRLRSYFFLGIFSTVCAASGYDAASNQSGQLTRIQKYMMCAPLYVAAQSAILFVLCLSTRCYLVASHFGFGGLLSILSFGLWLCNLVLTMHSEDSWAVNGIGEIEMANLYYFSWAAILTAGLQMMSYVKSFLRIKKTDYMSVVWVAICKVCFVILGAALHIWHTIADNCDFDEITSGAVTFCSRTVLAIIVALTGMLVGGLVVTGRLMVAVCPMCQCRRVQAHVEMLISLFLVLLFGAAVALITGIGGPGQSVGDLYYSTWLAFFVSIGIFLSCYDQIKKEDTALEDHKNNMEMDDDGDRKVVDGVLV
jgi:hypothetical protein